MRVLLTGAHGFIGNAILNGLHAHGHQVVAAVHRQQPLTTTDVSYVPVDFTHDHHSDDWLPRLKNIDVVINCVGIIRETSQQGFNALHRDAPIALFKACSLAGVKKVIQLSALGADAQASSQYHLSKRAADDFLATLDIDWLILRPSIVIGSRAASSELFRALAALPLIPIINHGRQKIQPIIIDDLVRIVIQSVAQTENSQQRIDAVGGEAVSLRDLLTLFRDQLGLGPARFIRIPFQLGLWLAALAKPLSNGIINRETVQMLQRDNIADVQNITFRFGFTPVSVSEWLSRHPVSQAERWQAQLFFLAPLLRISLAFLWIATGYISLFVFPYDESYHLLAKLGLYGNVASLALYTGGLIDIVLGLALFMQYQIRLVVYLQILIMITYTILISTGLPEFWLHPFGPITKNIPLIVATLMLPVFAGKR